MIWRTPDSDPYTQLVEAHGRLISSAGEEWRGICEARWILDLPIRTDRHRHVEKVIKRRCRKNSFDTSDDWDKACAVLRFKLEQAVLREWRARQEEAAA
jgi:hypothetical protein